MSERVLVTGGTGFIGVHCLVQLLEQGYTARTTVRSLRREGEVRAMLARAGADHSGLELAEAGRTTPRPSSGSAGRRALSPSRWSTPRAA